MDDNLNARDFRYFRTIADEGNITRASKKLYVSQPSLSQYIRHLEEKAGTTLFRRSASGITLTDAGRRFYALSTDVLREIDHFRDEVEEIGELAAGEIVFGITRHLGTLLLPEIVPKFHERWPGIRISIAEDTTHRQTMNLLSSQIDFALIHVPLRRDQNPAVVYEILEDDPLMIILPPGSAVLSAARRQEGEPFSELDIRHLREETFILTKKPQRIREFTDEVLEKADLAHPRTLIETTSVATVMHCVSAGLGVGFMPKHYLELRGDRDHFEVCAIPKRYHAVWQLCIATLRNGYLSRADRAFLDVVREEFGKTGGE